MAGNQATSGSSPLASTGPGFVIRSHHKVSYQLPQIVRGRNGVVILPAKDIASFVRHELHYGRLDDIVGWLWLAGRAENVRPLHRQLMIGRKIFVTEQADMHLLWDEDRIYIKPLGGWMFDQQVFKDHVCTANNIYAAACGFLQSYASLISYESDYRIAQDHGLIPADITWQRWTVFVADLLPHITEDCGGGSTYIVAAISSHCPRYRYGELRLSRVQRIYHFKPSLRFKFIWRGYFYGYRNYRSLIERNFAWLLVVFVYITIILTAMQVGLATNQLKNNGSFGAASYGFAVFSIVLPLATFAFWLVLSVLLTTYHVVTTLLHQRRLTRTQTPSAKHANESVLPSKSKV